MSCTSVFMVAQGFEECVYRRFGAPSLIRHDRDPRFMSEVFQAFAEIMQSRSRATLSYRPQANGQQERSVKTVMQSVRVYAEDPLQQDWDEIAERLVFAINNSFDLTQNETPFYLVHGWDARSTLKAMATSLRQGSGKQTDALKWRREVNRHHEIALKMAQTYQAHESSPSSRTQRELESSGTGSYSAPREPSADASNDQPGGTDATNKAPKPTRIPLLPVVHVSRPKPVNEYGDRPKTRWAPDITENSRFDFDEELLPEDSWEPDHLAGEYEVEAILDDRTVPKELYVNSRSNGSATTTRRGSQHRIYPAMGSSTTICVESGGTNDSRWSKSPTKTDTDNSK
ncbi:unnamed protein product [Phytophthora lilii]|uniref:Unnamed protein product n=1 Tax=Phytophthora lilii TaxID=2077276 RepID=A0A9W6XEM1_9STRA|nr:unnamed protein product [Phytophthora lilii]